MRILIFLFVGLLTLNNSFASTYSYNKTDSVIKTIVFNDSKENDSKEEADEEEPDCE